MGVTNIIPIFGPFLGAVPSAFLILLVSPRQCLYFILFIRYTEIIMPMSKFLRKMMTLQMPPVTATMAVAEADRIFSGFVRGKLLDSLIIGIICFFCCSLLKFPYTPIISKSQRCSPLFSR